MCAPEGSYISSGSGSWLFLTGLLLLCRLTADRALGASHRASFCLAVTEWRLFVVGLLTLSYSGFSQCMAGMCLCLESKRSWKFICFWVLA